MKLGFSLQLLFETFIILGRIQRDIVISVKTYSCKVPLIFVRFKIKLEFSRQVFKNVSRMKFHQNRSSGSRGVPCGQTDGRDEANSRLSQF